LATDPGKTDVLVKRFCEQDTPFDEFAEAVGKLTVSTELALDDIVGKYTKSDFVRYIRQAGISSAKALIFWKAKTDEHGKRLVTYKNDAGKSIVEISDVQKVILIGF
jgi:hypothetical protein